MPLIYIFSLSLSFRLFSALVSRLFICIVSLTFLILFIFFPCLTLSLSVYLLPVAVFLCLNSLTITNCIYHYVYHYCYSNIGFIIFLVSLPICKNIPGLHITHTLKHIPEKNNKKERKKERNPFCRSPPSRRHPWTGGVAGREEGVFARQLLRVIVVLLGP